MADKKVMFKSGFYLLVGNCKEDYEDNFQYSDLLRGSI